MPVCAGCATEFNSQRLSAKYCSAKCRVSASRDKVTASTELPVTLTPAGNGDGVSVTAMPGPQVVPPGLHVHDLHPHEHPVLEDGLYRGRRKKCSGRWWCRSCQMWMDGKLCHAGLG